MCKNKVLQPSTLIKDIEADDKGIIKVTYVNYETFGWDKEGIEVKIKEKTLWSFIFFLSWNLTTFLLDNL